MAPSKIEASTRRLLATTQEMLYKIDWSCGEVRIRVLFLFPVVYFSRGTLPQKRNVKRALLGDLVEYGVLQS